MSTDLAAAAVAVIGIAGWYVSVRLWPMGTCGSCEGTGRNMGSNGQRWGTCRRCKGRGFKRRLGARKEG